MYSVVLLAAISTGANAPDFFIPKSPVTLSGLNGTGCYGCGGGVVYSGCGGCTGCIGSCGGCTGGCTGCIGSCGGCVGGCIGVPVAPVHPAPVGVAFPAAFGTGTSYSYYGTCDGGGWGVGTSWSNHVPALPPLPAATSTDPKKEDSKTDEPKDEPDLKRYWFGYPSVPPEMLPDPKPNQEAESEARRARVVIRLPRDARLFIDDVPTKSTSAERTFRTPELEPKQTYFYLLRAEMEIDGRPVVLTKKITVKAGEVARAQFDDPRAVVQNSDR